MKSLKKKLVSMGLAVTLALSCLVVGGIPTQAAEKSYMENLKLKELKANKKNSFRVKVANSNKNWTGKQYITNLKKTNAKKKGYNKLTFTVCFEGKNVKLSKNSIYKNASNGVIGTSVMYGIVDDKTGKSLESYNNVNVTCSNSDWKIKYYPKQKDNVGNWIKMIEKSKVTVTVVYPKTYKNLGIIIGACTNDGKASTIESMDDFFNGNKAFGKSIYYKKCKNNMLYKKIK